MTEPSCGLCGKPATGLASIAGARYCQGDDDTEPTCYQQAQWASSAIYEAEAMAAGRPRVFFVPDIADPAAPTRAEMDRGIYLGPIGEVNTPWRDDS